MFLDPETAPGFKRSLFNAIVAPRPIGWISSLSATGVANLAPFSHFNLVSTAPPVLIFSCNAAGDRPEKDTLANVRATGEFVANLVTWDLREAMNQTSLNVPHGTDEFALAGLEKLASVKVRPPRVGAYLDEAFMTAQGHFDVARTRPLTRLGGSQYSSVGELVELSRPNPPLN